MQNAILNIRNMESLKEGLLFVKRNFRVKKVPAIYANAKGISFRLF